MFVAPAKALFNKAVNCLKLSAEGEQSSKKLCGQAIHILFDVARGKD